MKIKNLLNHMYKSTWTRNITMTDRSFGLVILVAAVVSATATVLTKRAIKRISLKISTPKPSKANNDNPAEFHEAVCSAEFPEGCMDKT